MSYSIKDEKYETILRFAKNSASKIGEKPFYEFITQVIQDEKFQDGSGGAENLNSTFKAILTKLLQDVSSKTPEKILNKHSEKLESLKGQLIGANSLLDLEKVGSKIIFLLDNISMDDEALIVQEGQELCKNLIRELFNHVKIKEDEEIQTSFFRLKSISEAKEEFFFDSTQIIYDIKKVLENLDNVDESNEKISKLKKINQNTLIKIFNLLKKVTDEKKQLDSHFLQPLLKDLFEADNTLNSDKTPEEKVEEVLDYTNTMKNRIDTQIGKNSAEKAVYEKQLQEMREKIKVTEEMVLKDSLTGVYNRRAFDNRLRDELSKCKSNTDNKFCLIFIDVDNFKAINDLHGHHTGDYILQTFTKKAKLGLREDDFLSRFGGDEFAIILPDCELPLAEKIAGRILNFIASNTISFENKEHRVTLSVGVTQCGKEDTTAEDILKKVDKAMYVAKKSGKNKINIIAADKVL